MVDGIKERGSSIRRVRMFQASNWKAWAKRDRTRFLNDVFIQPSIGTGAGWLLGALLVLVGWLTVVYAPCAIKHGNNICSQSANQNISIEAGYWTIGIVSVLAIIAGWEPIASRWLDGRRRVTLPKLLAWPIRILRVFWVIIVRLPSVILSTLDYLLARPIAIIAGTRIRRFWWRYGALLLWIGLTMAGAYWLPPHLALLSVCFGILLIFAVVRRWNWVERDRETFLAVREHDDDLERIGFREDLRDEALTSIIFLFFLIPLGLRQADLAYDVFDLVDAKGAVIKDIPTFWGWVGFFGAELAKSIPLVDWSEVFHVANGSPIKPTKAFGAQLVFFLRAAFDLLLIAAVVQAVQIASRLRDQSNAFWSGKLDILDPFAERNAFRRVESGLGDHPFVKEAEQETVIQFPQYRPNRLRQIATGLTNGNDAKSHVQEDRRSRLGAMAILACQHQSEETFACLRDLFLNEDPKQGPINVGEKGLREYALDVAIEAFPDNRLVAPLSELLQRNGSVLLKEKAAQTLGRLGLAEATDTLLQSLQNEDENVVVRAHAGLALAKFGETEAMTHLEDLMGSMPTQKHPRNTLRYAVIPATNAIVRLQKDSDIPHDLINSLPNPLQAFAIRGAETALGTLDQMVRIESGSFVMGSEEGKGIDDERPAHTVTIRSPFELGTYPVTFAEYDLFCEATEREKPSDEGWGRKRRPVINVSWDDALAYCAWLSRVTGELYRLPSESQWEYACRAGTDTEYSTGDTITKKQARFSEGDLGSAKQTVPVGSFAPNAFGLYDMHGNVWEWCADPWHENYQGAPANESVWVRGESSFVRVLRGGSWVYYPRILRARYRDGSNRDSWDSSWGFRVSRALALNTV